MNYDLSVHQFRGVKISSEGRNQIRTKGGRTWAILGQWTVIIFLSFNLGGKMREMHIKVSVPSFS